MKSWKVLREHIIYNYSCKIVSLVWMSTRLWTCWQNWLMPGNNLWRGIPTLMMISYFDLVIIYWVTSVDVYIIYRSFWLTHSHYLWFYHRKRKSYVLLSSSFFCSFSSHSSVSAVSSCSSTSNVRYRRYLEASTNSCKAKTPDN